MVKHRYVNIYLALEYYVDFRIHKLRKIIFSFYELLSLKITRELKYE